MTDFPESASHAKELAIKLVRHLKNGIRNTKGPAGVWKARNFRLLHEFCRGLIVDPIYSGPKTGPESLWDFVGYMQAKGDLITAESEFDTSDNEIAKDFDKLLYGSSPIKLMICRIHERCQAISAACQEAERIRTLLEGHIRGNCAHYPPGSVFILYCVWWAEPGGPNRDFPYILQVDGEPAWVPVRSEQQFQPVSC